MPLRFAQWIAAENPSQRTSAVPRLPNTTGRWKLAHSEADDWSLDRDIMRRMVEYSGIRNGNMQDQAMTESMGMITDHSFDHLAPSAPGRARSVKQGRCRQAWTIRRSIWAHDPAGTFVMPASQAWQDAYAAHISRAVRVSPDGTVSS